MDLFVIKEGKKLRCGYTTGSCAAAAAKAAAMILFCNTVPEYINISTPAGVELSLRVEKPVIGEDFASCCIIKDAGDDPDVTDGIEIYAKVTKREDSNILIDGGLGIGRITRKGFWGEAGDAAINPVPRQMIHDEVSKVTDGGVNVLIYAPQGVEIGKKTFNPNLGIEGGISIIGTKGIVEPMSDEALKKTIYLELDELRRNSIDEVVLYPGNYGERAVEDLHLPGGRVKISNYIGDAILYGYNAGFKKITLVGHIGKLCKLSVGCFNTHSKISDVRMEAFVYYLAIEGAPLSILQRVNEAITSEEALKIAIEGGYGRIAGKMKEGSEERIKRYIKDKEFDINVIMYSMDYGVL